MDDEQWPPSSEAKYNQPSVVDGSYVALDQSSAPSHLCTFWTYAVTVIPVALMLAWIVGAMDKYSGFTSNWTDAWKAFNWHPLCMMIAYGCIFSQALVAFKMLPISYQRRKMVHMMLQSCAVIFATVGIIVIVQFKYHLKPKPDQFYTVHAWIGIITYSLFCLQFLLGGLFMFKPRLFLWFFPAQENFVRSVLPWHVLAGISIYLSAVLSLVTGVLNRQWAGPDTDAAEKHGLEWNLSNVVGLSVAVCGSTVFYLHKRRRADDVVEENISMG